MWKCQSTDATATKLHCEVFLSRCNKTSFAFHGWQDYYMAITDANAQGSTCLLCLPSLIMIYTLKDNVAGRRWEY